MADDTSAPALPAWFERAVATPGASHFVTSRGARLHYLAWGLERRVLPGLLFVHGYRAHARYWDGIAPYFAGRYRVVAMDLAGMGDSGRREAYSALGFAQDIAAVIEDAGLGPAAVVGHSFGGARALRTAAEFPGLIRHVIAVDSICRFADSPPSSAGTPRRPRTEPYPDYASARARYRLTPDQPCDNGYLVDHIARHSLRREGDGWLWKFDPFLPPGPHEPDAAVVLGGLDVPVDYVRGEFSTVVRQQEAERIVACLRHGRGPVVVPQAYHYLMLDQPLALVAALRALLA
ncbi:Haloalkane dehalogenase [Pigmentiphaga humi]|uniref:Haloalkane dehalogenase n=1 Tax=Pigmentiphaga humi TaxID=2478468 RepID=A0A3P4AYG1_9BURK|nr:alpha/beta hydrolase [Pigmentiphaga humi]VCU68601.1 Haloalkane dehalogenase [Pigmentiphaga humi]